MTNIDFVGYLAVCVVAAGTPGPGTLAVINQSLTNGVKRTVPLIIGIGLGLACASVVAIVSLLYSYSIAPWTYQLIGLCGTCYLGYLGLKLIVSANNAVDVTSEEEGGTLDSNLALQGFYISLLNPKTILFLLAIYPVYLNSASTFSANFINLTVSLVTVTASIHIVYSILCAKIAKIININNGLIMRVTGVIFIAFALMLFYETIRTFATHGQ